MLDDIRAEIPESDFYKTQGQVETKVTELIRFVVIEAVKHGHELATYRHRHGVADLEHIKRQKKRLIEEINQCDNANLSRLVKEIIQADLLYEGRKKKVVSK